MNIDAVYLTDLKFEYTTSKTKNRVEYGWIQNKEQ
jgi:hypothetical protein